jgi:general nucleoside transport system permease protein
MRAAPVSAQNLAVFLLLRRGGPGPYTGIFTVARAAILFVAASSLFFLLLGKSPTAVLWGLVEGALGNGFALSETLVRAAPILLCALATALPARVGLISVGAEGQLVLGAITGTGFALFGGNWGAAGWPLLLLFGALGGAAWGGLAGWLRARLGVNETISTLLLNYIAPPLIDYLVYGPWKDPASLGWPATRLFPDSLRLTGYLGTRLHGGLLLGLLAIVAMHALVSSTRFGVKLDLLRESPMLAARAGLAFAPAALGMLALGGAMAGTAGIIEASALEGRLQAGVGSGAGYAGFLVAFLARGSLLRIVPLALVVAALVAGGDNLQLSFDLPSSVAHVLQGLLFAAALIAGAERNPARSTEAR